VVAKALDSIYEPDRRGWLKVKPARTADCVVGGYRLHKSGPDAIGSLLLGLYTDEGELASVGVVGAFPMARRRDLLVELQPLVTSFEGHPWDWARHLEAVGGTWRGSETSRWNPGKELSFVPLRPERSWRSATTTSRAAASATPPSSCVGATTGNPARAPTPSSRRRSATTSPTSWRPEGPDPQLDYGIG
jgi:ATP-dependent DNA ligase